MRGSPESSPGIMYPSSPPPLRLEPAIGKPLSVALIEFVSKLRGDCYRDKSRCCAELYVCGCDVALVAGYLDLVPVMLPLRLARRRGRGQLAARPAALACR